MILIISVGSIMRCILKCPEESGIAAYGLRALYNFMYRCEGAQAEVLDTDGAAEKLVAFVRKNFQGDFDCMRNCRRFELAIQPDGYRGNVEMIIEEEMKLDQIRKAPKPFQVQEAKVDIDALADSKRAVGFFDESKTLDIKKSFDYKVELAEGKYIEDNSEIDSKASHKHVKKEHKPRLAARDMKLEEDDDVISVASELTM